MIKQKSKITSKNKLNQHTEISSRGNERPSAICCRMTTLYSDSFVAYNNHVGYIVEIKLLLAF